MARLLLNGRATDTSDQFVAFISLTCTASRWLSVQNSLAIGTELSLQNTVPHHSLAVQVLGFFDVQRLPDARINREIAEAEVHEVFAKECSL